jgi:hypothetical protein
MNDRPCGTQHGSKKLVVTCDTHTGPCRRLTRALAVISGFYFPLFMACRPPPSSPHDGLADAGTDAPSAGDEKHDDGIDAETSGPACTNSSAGCPVGQVCCLVTSVQPGLIGLQTGTTCQMPPCPDVLRRNGSGYFDAGPLQLCATAAECATTGDTCDPLDPCAPGLPLAVCEPGDSGATGCAEGGSTGDDTGASDAPPADAGGDAAPE